MFFVLIWFLTAARWILTVNVRLELSALILRCIHPYGNPIGPVLLFMHSSSILGWCSRTMIQWCFMPQQWDVCHWLNQSHVFKKQTILPLYSPKTRKNWTLLQFRPCRALPGNLLVMHNIRFLWISDLLIFSNSFWPMTIWAHIFFPPTCRECQASPVAEIAYYSHSYCDDPLADADL